MDILRDPIWQFVFSLIGIIVTFAIYRFQEKRKRLSYAIVFSTSLLSVSRDLKKDSLQVNWRGRDIDGLHLLAIRLTNVGDIPIVASDFESPVSFSFDFAKESGEVLEAEVIPTEVSATLKTTKTSVELKPALMNKGDLAEIKVLLTDFSGEVKVTGRVVGVKTIEFGATAFDWIEIPLITYAVSSTFITLFCVAVLLADFLLPNIQTSDYILGFCFGFIVVHSVETALFFWLRWQHKEKSKSIIKF
jgi:hypothetical protein